MKITLYGTTTSYWTNELKAYLERKKFPFEERLLDQDEKAEAELRGMNYGYKGVPLLIVEKDNGEKKYIIGYDKGTLEEVLK